MINRWVVVFGREEEEEERLLWQNKCALYTIIIQSIDMIGLATETPIKTCNMSLACRDVMNSGMWRVYLRDVGSTLVRAR